MFIGVKGIIEDIEVDPSTCVGCCFDGAFNVRGKDKGLSSRLKEICPLILYVHCHGHRLSLGVKASLSNVLPLKTALGVIQSLYVFIEASPKRHATFCNIVVDEDGSRSFART